MKAVPLFNSGELSTASPRALVSWQSLLGWPALRRGRQDRNHSLSHAGASPVGSCPSRGAPASARRATDHKRLYCRRLAAVRTAKAPHRGQQSEQPDQGQRTGRGRERLGCAAAPRLFRSRPAARVTTCGKLHLFAGGLDGHDRRPLQFRHHRRVSRFDRLGDFDREFRLAVKRTGVLVALASATAFAFG